MNKIELTNEELEQAFTKATEVLYIEDQKPTQDQLNEYYELHEELHRRAKLSLNR